MNMRRETARSVEAFTIFCQLGPDRTLAKTREAIGKIAGRKAPIHRTVEEWSRLFQWQTRAIDYDRELSRRELDETMNREARQRANRREVRLNESARLHVLVEEALRLAQATQWSPSQILAAIQVAGEIDRLEYGDPTENQQITIAAEDELYADMEKPRRVVVAELPASEVIEGEVIHEGIEQSA